MAYPVSGMSGGIEGERPRRELTPEHKPKSPEVREIKVGRLGKPSPKRSLLHNRQLHDLLQPPPGQILEEETAGDDRWTYQQRYSEELKPETELSFDVDVPESRPRPKGKGYIYTIFDKKTYKNIKAEIEQRQPGSGSH